MGKLKKFVPPHDPLWTDGWASAEQPVGINRTSLGHTLPMLRATNAQIIKFIWALSFLFPTSIQRKHNEEYLHGCTSLSCRRDNLLSEKADRFIVESKQLDLIRTKIGKHDAIDPQTFLRWNEASDKEKIKQKTGKRLKKPKKISLK